ncbi:cytochrome P450 family protein [Ceratobasidium sp. AG-Ba]|nr:cytochrome P450 family protein [Ceratobasidium sp. AG-Ba]QRV99298.1 cytochrome P450 family protein [Ceratobasidium sp. AG-Ba]QRW13798.1 cytochrome P450 family protein [Ceratobasidium sp. AG-Ba]
MEKIVISGALAASALAYYAYTSRPRRMPLPPRPPGHWLFGNALEIGAADAFWVKLGEYADVHGPLISIRMLHQYAYIISDPYLVTELFEKRSVNYSDRDENEMSKLTGLDTDVVMLQYGPKLKQYRTMLNRALNNRVSQDYIPLQEQEVKKFMKRLVGEPEKFLDHVRLLAASLAVRLAYGYTIESFDDPIVETAEKWMAGFSDFIQPWSYAVNIIPSLRYLPEWLPIAPFQRRAIELRGVLKELREKPFHYVLEQMTAGTAEESYASKLLQSEGGAPVNEETKEAVMRTAATFYAAGSDTTVSAIQSFFLAMALHPETQVKAQAELATYLGSGPQRIILPKDEEHLPYTSALFKEVLRWHPVIPVVHHRSSKDDDNNVVCGDKRYRIPARSNIMVNVWKISHDSSVYPEPESFLPERFLVDNSPPSPETYVFGFGRSMAEYVQGYTLHGSQCGSVSAIPNPLSVRLSLEMVAGIGYRNISLWLLDAPGKKASERGVSTQETGGEVLRLVSKWGEAIHPWRQW